MQLLACKRRLVALLLLSSGCASGTDSQNPNGLASSEEDLLEGATWPMPNRPGAGLPNERSYDLSSEQVVLDEVTGLSWQRQLGSQFFDWEGAAAYCEQLSLDGNSDWRLPTRIELVSLISLEWVDPAIDEEAFPNTPSDWFWTATANVADPETAWNAYFYFGYPGLGRKDDTVSVRCVRSESSASKKLRYSLSDEIVRDEYTGLTWQRRASDESFSFEQAQAYCADLTLGSDSAWRTPSMLELQSIVDPGRAEPAISSVVFPDTPPVEFWSSTPWTETPDLRGWYVDFRDGSALYLDGTMQERVRCVR